MKKLILLLLCVITLLLLSAQGETYSAPGDVYYHQHTACALGNGLAVVDSTNELFPCPICADDHVVHEEPEAFILGDTVIIRMPDKWMRERPDIGTVFASWDKDVYSGNEADKLVSEMLHGAEYRAFLDSDDEWLPEKLERQIAFMRKKNAAFSCTAYDRVDENGNVLNRVTPFEKADYGKVLFYANPVGNSTAMFDRETLGDLRVPAIRKRNDFALWLAALKVTDYVYGMSDCLARYTVRVSSVSSNKRRLIRYQWQLYRQVEHLSLARTLWAFTGLVYIKLAHPTWRGERRKDT